MAILLLAGLILAGCATPKSRPAPPPSTATPPPEFLKPSLLYLLAAPHSRIYVEVDAVEGCEPTEAALVQLQKFLIKHCQKPDGVEIMVSDIIPRKAARKTTPRTLGRRYMNGPPDDQASPPAFMYVLYYPGWPGRVPPFADIAPYPAIYFNTRFSLGIAVDEILPHETGHLLGLVNRTAHAKRGHCWNSGCAMNNHWGYLRNFGWLPWRKQSQLCTECVNELTQAAKQSPPANLRYVGPVLVRSESLYDVLILPERFLLVIGGATKADCEQFTTSVRAAPDNPSNWYRLDCQAKVETFADPQQVCRIMGDLRADPLGIIGQNGPRVLLRAALQRYENTRQYTNAVILLQHAIQSSPAEAQNYNQLAWLRATCSEAAVRNGAEAVPIAQQACELTRWQERNSIDTLAAAYAETGDFKHAIEFQQQALRTGKPNASEQTAMHERLALYQQAKPFREPQR